MTVKRPSTNAIDLKALVAEDCDGMKSLIKAAVQEVLEAEMTELLGAGPHERQEGCQGYRAGHDERGLVTRIGKLDAPGPPGPPQASEEHEHAGALERGDQAPDVGGADLPPYRVLPASGAHPVCRDP